MDLYDAMTSGGKGGPIAHAIIEYQNPDELKAWVVEATPAALGPILMTLTSNPEDFSIAATEVSETSSAFSKQDYPKDKAHLAQQLAIGIIIDHIVTNAKEKNALEEAQKQFELACASMNKFGVEPVDIGQKYCENRYLLDNFMSDPVLSFTDPRGNKARARYKENSKILGQRIDGSCKIVMGENNYIPRTSVKYLPAASAEF
jgi:hypothetical protein